jgi:hypothetical protein
MANAMVGFPTTTLTFRSQLLRSDEKSDEDDIVLLNLFYHPIAVFSLHTYSYI